MSTTAERVTIIASRMKAGAVDADTAHEQIRVMVTQDKADPAAVMLALGTAVVEATAQAKAAQRELRQAMADMGKLRTEIQDARGELAQARSLDDQIDANQQLMTLLQRRLDATKNIIKLQREAGQDVGYGDRQLAEIKGQLRQAQAQMEALQQRKAQQTAARFALPQINAGTVDLNAAKSAADEVQKLTDKLREQAQTVGMTAGQIELYRLAKAGATQEQLNLARGIIGYTEARERIGEVTKALAELKGEVQRFGMTDAQTKLLDLKAMGASPEQLAQAKAMLDQMQAMQKAKSDREAMEQRAESIFESTRTPLEQYETKIGELSDMLKAGMIDWQTYGRAVRAARGELEQASAVNPVADAPTAVRANTAEAQRFVYDQTRGVQKLTRDDVPKKALAEAQSQTRLLEQVAKNTRPQAEAAQVMDL